MIGHINVRRLANLGCIDGPPIASTHFSFLLFP